MDCILGKRSSPLPCGGPIEFEKLSMNHLRLRVLAGRTRFKHQSRAGLSRWLESGSIRALSACCGFR